MGSYRGPRWPLHCCMSMSMFCFLFATGCIRSYTSDFESSHGFFVQPYRGQGSYAICQRSCFVFCLQQFVYEATPVTSNQARDSFTAVQRPGELCNVSTFMFCFLFATVCIRSYTSDFESSQGFFYSRAEARGTMQYAFLFQTTPRFQVQIYPPMTGSTFGSGPS